MRSKAILMALLALAFSGVEAVPVTRIQATSAAQAWVKRGVRLGARIGATVKETSELTAADGARFYAVKMQGGGTVLMSGDTDYEPVMAFSSDEFDPSAIAPGSPLEALINADLAFRRRAAEVKAKGAVRKGQVESAAARRWARLLPKAASVPANGVDMAAPIEADANVLDDMRVDILLETKWNQSSAVGWSKCFNYYTPNNYVCGCVATATAQLMRYHCWPTNDVPKFSKTCQVDGVPTRLTALGGPYEWTNMPPVMVTKEEEAMAMGRLSYECGVAVEMMYGEDGSGAITADVPERLKDTFSYTNALWCSQSLALSSDEETRERIIYPSLDAGYPVIFSIRGNLGGHAVVCDGYGYNMVDGEKTPYVHINMGWKGANNWWYNLPNMDVGNNPESFEGFDILSGVAYDVFPTVQGRVISGRVLDADGLPVVGAKVTIDDTTVVSTNHGVYAFILKRAAGPVEVFAESEDGRYMGYVELELGSGGDSWGNDVTISRPAVEVNGLEFSTLDRALEYAATNVNPTLRILLDVDFRHPFTITNSCTIVATNPVPSASKILPVSGAMLTLAKGADVTFTNVVFNHGDRLMVEAKTGSVVRVSGVAGLGELRLAEPSNLRLTGSLQSAIVVDAPFAKRDGEVFGLIEGASPAACETYAQSANCFLDKYDDETGGEGYWSGSGYQLRWKLGAEVPLAAAAVQYEGDAEPVNYRSLAVFFKYHPESGTAAILKDATLTNNVTVGGAMTLYGAAETPVTVRPAAAARLTVEEGGSLVISNLTVSGYTGSRLFRVNGGEMTLGEGAVLRDLKRTLAVEEDIGEGGATILEAGTLTVMPGAAIRNCSVVGDGTFNAYGGGIYACGGTLNLLGGEISGCVADLGGGVYVDMSWGDLDVNLAGDLRIVRNWHEGSLNESGLSSMEPDNLCVNGLAIFEEDAVYHPVVTGALAETADVGISYAADAAGNGVGETFAEIGEALTPEEAASSAEAFSNDLYLQLWPKVAEDESGATVLQWSESVLDPADARALVIYGEGLPTAETNCYGSVEAAFASLTNDATVVVMKDKLKMSEEVTVRHQVVLKSDDASARPYVFDRYLDVSFTIEECGSLVVSNLWFDGCGSYGDENGDGAKADVNPLFDVIGGSLTLGGGAVVSNILGYASTSAGAVYVHKSGVFRLEEGAEIVECVNVYEGQTAGVTKDADAGLAGGVVLAGGRAYLRGGVIRDCFAQKGGGVFVGNDSVAYVSGSFQATENGCWKDSPDPDYARYSNITYDGNGLVCLDGVYTGLADVGCGWNMTAPGSTNVFGFVEYEGDVGTLVPSAAQFHNDREPTATGFIVSNDVQTLLVWSTAIQIDEQTGASFFEDEEGNRYAVVQGSTPPPTPPPPTPPEWTVVTNQPDPIAFKSIERVSDTEWALVITNRKQYCNYRLIYTDDLSKGFTVTGDWEHAVGPAAEPVWTTNVITTGGAWFWRAEGTEGTNMVPPQVEN